MLEIAVETKGGITNYQSQQPSASSLFYARGGRRWPCFPGQTRLTAERTVRSLQPDPQYPSVSTAEHTSILSPTYLDRSRRTVGFFDLSLRDISSRKLPEACSRLSRRRIDLWRLSISWHARRTCRGTWDNMRPGSHSSHIIWKRHSTRFALEMRR